MLDRGLNALRMYPVPADVRRLMYKVKHAQGVDITRTVSYTHLRHLHLFVLLVLVVVVIFQFQRLLVLDDLLHELLGGVVLAGIFLLLGLHHDLGEHDVIRLQFDVQHPGAGFQFYFLGDIEMCIRDSLCADGMQTTVGA